MLDDAAEDEEDRSTKEGLLCCRREAWRDKLLAGSVTSMDTPFVILAWRAKLLAGSVTSLDITDGVEPIDFSAGAPC
jgi:hypothetical protein